MVTRLFVCGLVDALDIIPSKVLYLYRAGDPLFFTPHHMREDPVKIAPRYSGHLSLQYGGGLARA
jgi:hypothetical protein